MDERIPLLVEGVATSDGRYIEPGAIHWTDPIPVTAYDDDGESHLVGRATDIRRSEDGVISAVITTYADLGGYPSADVGADVDGYASAYVELDRGDAGYDRLTVREGRLRGVSILPEDGWPWPNRPRASTTEGPPTPTL